MGGEISVLSWFVGEKTSARGDAITFPRVDSARRGLLMAVAC